MTIDLSPEALAKIEAGCDATGSATFSLSEPHDGYVELNTEGHFAFARVVWQMQDDADALRSSPRCEALALHIARCDPATIRALCQEITKLRAENALLREAVDGVYLYANDTLSGRVDGGVDDRAWQRSAVVEIRNRARMFATVQSAVAARAALEGDK